MKVWIVYDQPAWQAGEIVSVHATEQLARDAVAQMVAEMARQLGPEHPSVANPVNLEVQEWDVQERASSSAS